MLPFAEIVVVFAHERRGWTVVFGEEPLEEGILVRIDVVEYSVSEPDAEGMEGCCVGILAFREDVVCAKAVVSPYGEGHAGEKIAAKVFEIVMDGGMDLKKKFFDLDFNV